MAIFEYEKSVFSSFFIVITLFNPKTTFMNTKQELIDSINLELWKIPDFYLNNLFQIIHTFRQNLPKTVEQKSKEHQLFMSLYGSWQSEKSGDELMQEIYKARMDQPRNIEL